MSENKPILCLDFDGVLHNYTSGWKGANVIPDGPVPGAMAFLIEATKRFRVAVFSSRSNQENGISAMRFRIAHWLRLHLLNDTGCDDGNADLSNNLRMEWDRVLRALEWPLEKPPALVTIDDRAITFTGTFPDLDVIANFKPWNKP